MRSANIGDNKYCGPTVLSILTGKSTDECASVLSFVTGRSNITLVRMSELKACLSKMRYEYVEKAYDCSLYSLFMQISKETGFYIVELPQHVVAIEVDTQGRVYLCDNHTKEPINGAASARLGQRAQVCYKVTPKPDPVYVQSQIELIQSKSYGRVTLSLAMWDIYENEEDNIRRDIGTLYAKDENELKLIRDEMLRKI